MNTTRMQIAITGASGLIGTALSRRLQAEGHGVTRLVRSRDAAGEPDAVYWKPTRGEIDADGLAGHDVVINLAGENIAGIWTAAKKERMYRSRVDGTRLLAGAVADLPPDRRPSLLINASAVGYYGDRPAETPLDENARPGDTFMAHLVRDWEEATTPAKEAGIRVVCTRFGLVLDPEGTLLQGMTLATRLGVGATIGDGRQMFPWTTREEIANVVVFCIARTELHGAVNVVAPDAVTNRELTDTLAGVMERPRFLSIPAFVVRLTGDLGDELLGGARVVPRKLQDAGYVWRDPRLEPALRKLLNRNGG